MHTGMKSSPASPSTVPATETLVDLCAGVLPVWARHLGTCKLQSEQAVSQMLQAFSDIGPHIDMAERQSQQITEALSPTEGGITGLAEACAQALQPLSSHAQLPEGGAQAIARALALVQNAVSALENISKPFAHQTQMVAQQVDRMYMGLQYQDRISQMMSLLESDMARLQEALNSPGASSPDVDAWLKRLESQYAMAEQRSDHQQKGGTNKPAGNSQETEFF